MTDAVGVVLNAIEAARCKIPIQPSPISFDTHS